jgi:hypothetical protein
MEKIKINTIIEIVGMPKEHVEETMNKVVSLIKEDKEIELITHDTAETKMVKDLWSTFTEFELDFKDFKKLTGFCFDFMPSSVEILEPVSPKVSSEDVSELLNDVLAKIHQYDMALKRMILEQRAKKKIEEKTNSSEAAKKA